MMKLRTKHGGKLSFYFRKKGRAGRALGQGVYSVIRYYVARIHPFCNTTARDGDEGCKVAMPTNLFETTPRYVEELLGRCRDCMYLRAMVDI